MSSNERVYGPLLEESLDVCETVAEWTAGLRQFPGALGIRDAGFVDPSSLRAMCFAAVADTPVCAEAIADGTVHDPTT